MEIKYDVFISYSRHDYVDENKNVIEGNVISIIKEFLENNGISYWIDEEGDLTGKKFAHIIAKAIRESMIFLFVCTKNSVTSKWVDRELSTADTFDKHIIPFICDNSYKDDNVVLYTSALDRIEYYTNPQKEIEKLLTSIKSDKKKHEEYKRKEIELQQKRIREEEERKKKLEEEAKKEKVKEEIRVYAENYLRLMVQQETIVKQLVNKNILIGHEAKVCPVCDTKFSLSKQYCENCGWQFPMLYSLDGNENYVLDGMQLSIARTNWHSLKNIAELRIVNQDLQKINIELKEINRTLVASNTKKEQLLKELSEKENKYLYEIKKYQVIIDSLKNIDNENTILKNKLFEIEQEKNVAIKQTESLRDELKLCEDKYKKASIDYMYELLDKKQSSETVRKLDIKQTNNGDNVSTNYIGTNEDDSYHAFQEVQLFKKDIFQFIKTFCNNKNINSGTDIAKAKIKYNKLSIALNDTYHITISEHKLKSFSTVGDLIDVAWKLYQQYYC